MRALNYYGDIAGLLARAVKRQLLALALKLGWGAMGCFRNPQPYPSAQDLKEGCELYLKDYLSMLAQPPEFLRGKKILELGTGEHVGMPLLFTLYGAKIITIDAFDHIRLDKEVLKIYQLLYEEIGSDAGDISLQEIIELLSQGRHPTSFGKDAPLQMQLTPAEKFWGDGFDLIVSRAVLEHVFHVDAVIARIHSALAPGGVTAHVVDFSSHNLSRGHPLQFLEWPAWAYQAAFPAGIRPNRLRAGELRSILEKQNLEIVSWEDAQMVPEELMLPWWRQHRKLFPHQTMREVATLQVRVVARKGMGMEV